MHEYSVVRSLLRQIELLAKQHRASRVNRVQVSVGEFSGVDIDLLESAFVQLAPESIARGAALQLRRVGLRAECRTCQQSFDVENFRFRCPVCEETEISVIGGEHLVLDSVTLEAEA
jgi:hydrogenase nickel incorporation protein HypA/HybF